MIKKKLLILLITLVFLSSCNSFKSAITGEKKKPGREFMVIKKEPLTLPPDFEDLPEPEEEEVYKEEETVEVKKILKGIANNTEVSTGASEGLEDSILKKIKKN
tara:strand:- start:286 stop:597 length:312 start_codon:yes stop_codon:yes gene_type:complete